MTLTERQQALGAQIAPDGVPLHFGDIASEYDAGQNGTVLMERSHEARIQITGEDRLTFLNNITTNDLTTMADGEGRGTVLTKSNARIIDRFLVYNRGETTLLLTGPGRGQAVMSLLDRNIFFNDDAQPQILDGRQFVLHGPNADDVINKFGLDAVSVAPLHGVDIELAGQPVFVARRKSLSGAHWSVTVPQGADDVAVWDAILDAGARPAGAIAYNMLRIRAGAPAHGREIHPDYIPLEVGLWDEVSFAKGCYTGQEIIARMESRARLARVMVRVELDAPAKAPTPLNNEDDRAVGTLTSSVTTTADEYLGIAVVKNDVAVPGTQFRISNGATATVLDLAGAAPPTRMLKGTAG